VARKACRIARRSWCAVKELYYLALAAVVVEDRAVLVPDIEPVPGVVVLAGVLRALESF
jgi:hypothetical protein